MMMLVGGVGSTKVAMALATFADALTTLWRVWETAIRLLHPMEQLLALT